MIKFKNVFGVKKIESFFSKQEIESIKSQIKDLIEHRDKKDFIWKFYEKNKKLNRIEYFVNYSEFFRKLSKSTKILNELKKLYSEEFVLFKDKINFKYPGGLGFEPHQDISAGWGRYTNFQISIAIPLTDTTIENGAIEFGPKLTEMRTNFHEDLNEDFDYDLITTKLGDIILFDSYIPHKSNINNSKGERPILFFTYTFKKDGLFYEKYHSDKFKVVPPDIYKIKGEKYRSGNSNREAIFE